MISNGEAIMGLGLILSTLVYIIIGIFVILQFISASWVRRDIATNKKIDKILWFLVVFIVPFQIGLLVYLFYRKNNKIENIDEIVEEEKSVVEKVVVGLCTMIFVLTLICLSIGVYNNMKIYSEYNKLNNYQEEDIYPYFDDMEEDSFD